MKYLVLLVEETFLRISQKYWTWKNSLLLNIEECGTDRTGRSLKNSHSLVKKDGSFQLLPPASASWPSFSSKKPDSPIEIAVLLSRSQCKMCACVCKYIHIVQVTQDSPNFMCKQWVIYCIHNIPFTLQIYAKSILMFLTAHVWHECNPYFLEELI